MNELEPGNQACIDGTRADDYSSSPRLFCSAMFTNLPSHDQSTIPIRPDLLCLCVFENASGLFASVSCLEMFQANTCMHRSSQRGKFLNAEVAVRLRRFYIPFFLLADGERV